MKLQDLFEAKKTLSFEMPSASEIAAAKQKFRTEIQKGRLYHATSEKAAKKILVVGFRPMAYFSYGEANWDGDVILTVDGKHVVDNIYPDPEHFIDSEKFNELFDNKNRSWGYKQVAKQIDKDLLFWLYYDLKKQEDWPDGLDGSWLICLESVPAEFVKED